VSAASTARRCSARRAWRGSSTWRGTWPPGSDADSARAGTGGGSDGNLTAALGVPTLDGLGAVGGGAHADDEHVSVGDLGWRAALLAGLLKRILAV